MKRFYTFLTVAAVSLITALSASASFTFKVVIDDTDAVQVCKQVPGETSMEYIPYEYGPDGAVITCEGGWMSVYFVGVEGILYNVYEATPDQTQEEATLLKEAKTGVSYLDLGQTITGYNPDGYTYYVVSYTDEKDAKITVNFTGDLSKVDCFTIQDKTYDLVEGTQVFEYNSKLASFASLMLPLYGAKAIYSVKYDGNEVEPTTLMGDFYQYTFRNLKSAKEHTVDINTEYPDVDYSFTINVTEGCEDFIYSVLVNNEEVESYASIHAGNQVTVLGDDIVYKVNKFTVNGEEISFMQSWSTIINRDLTLDFDVKAWPIINVNVNIDDAEAVDVLQGWKVINLVTGDNDLILSTGLNQLQFFPRDDREIASITIDGYPIDGSAGWIVDDMEEGSEIIVKIVGASAIETITNDNKAASDAVFNLQGIAVGSAENLHNLPTGLYIVGGKKIFKN